MSAKKQTRPSADPTPVRFTDDQKAMIAETARLLGESQQTVIRLSLSAGLVVLRRLSHGGLAELIADEALKSR
jgi:hypothetical protein